MNIVSVATVVYVGLLALYLACPPFRTFAHYVVRTGLRGMLSLGLAEHGLRAWISSPQPSMHHNFLRTLCAIMDWPLATTTDRDYALHVVEHPTLGPVWGFYTPRALPTQASLDIIRPLDTPEKIRMLLDALLNQACIQKLPDGLTVLLPEDSGITGHARLALTEALRARPGSSGYVATLTGILGDLYDPYSCAYIVLKSGSTLVVLCAADDLLHRLQAPGPTWAHAWTPYLTGSMHGAALLCSLYIPESP